MPVNVARSRDRRPIDFRVARFEVGRQFPRCFGDDFQRADNRIDGFGIRDKAAISQAAGKFPDQIDIFEYVPQPLSGIL